MAEVTKSGGGGLHGVTGAFGYSGARIAARLLREHREIATLTNSPRRDEEAGRRIRVFPLSFGQPDKLARNLAGVKVLYNTYWVRFNHRNFTHAEAVRNTLALFDAARRAGVQRVVHISITNPDKHSPLEYFAGKGRLEEALMESGIGYAILRPAVLFGHGDILINNIAWALRRFPVFAVFGDGQYKLQPIHVDDLAELAVACGKERENRVINAIGPETFTYRDLVRQIGVVIGRQRRVVEVSPRVGALLGRVIGWIVRDQFITPEEIDGLMRSLLYVDAIPTGRTRLTEWMRANAHTLGVRYASELARRSSERARPGAQQRPNATPPRPPMT